MSTLRVEGIKNAAASSDAITLAADGTCTAKITNNLSNRNLIINGAMQIAQRGTSSTAQYYQTLDRWSIGQAGMDEAPTQAQVVLTSGDTGPWAKGFRKALQVTNGNQTSGAGAGDILQILYKIEAQDISNSGWDYTSASSYLTYSFWVKSSISQNFNGKFTTVDGTGQNYHFQTGSLSANTWTYVTKTFPGNSNITVNDDTGEGFRIYLYPFAGTNNTESITLNQWSTNTTCGPDMTSTWYTTNDSTIALTGVQLEVSDHATEFEHRSYGDELARCQRYYEVLYMSAGTACCYSSGDATIKYAHTWYFKHEKRVQASVALLGNAAFSVSGGSSITLTGIFTSKDHVMFYYDSGMFRLGDGNQDASVKAESEL